MNEYAPSGVSRPRIQSGSMTFVRLISRGGWWMKQINKLKSNIAIICVALGIMLLPIGLYCYKYSVVETILVPGFAPNYLLKYPYIGVGIFVMILGSALLLAGFCYLIIAKIQEWSRFNKSG